MFGPQLFVYVLAWLSSRLRNIPFLMQDWVFRLDFHWYDEFLLVSQLDRNVTEKTNALHFSTLQLNVKSVLKFGEKIKQNELEQALNKTEKR